MATSLVLSTLCIRLYPLALPTLLAPGILVQEASHIACGQQSAAEERAQVEKERERWQNVEEIFDMLGLAEGSRVADIGAGGGFFTVRLARSVGKIGRVLAVDIDDKVVTELRQRVKEAGLQNVDVILGEDDNPKLSDETLDAALIVDSYHEMKKHQAMLERIHQALKPGGRLMLIEPFLPAQHNTPRESKERDHVIAPELVEKDLRQAGFEIVARNDEFIERRNSKTIDWFILARRPSLSPKC